MNLGVKFPTSLLRYWTSDALKLGWHRIFLVWGQAAEQWSVTFEN